MNSEKSTQKLVELQNALGSEHFVQYEKVKITQYSSTTYSRRLLLFNLGTSGTEVPTENHWQKRKRAKTTVEKAIDGMPAPRAGRQPFVVQLFSCYSYMHLYMHNCASARLAFGVGKSRRGYA
jgi:hypothetical protein